MQLSLSSSSIYCISGNTQALPNGLIFKGLLFGPCRASKKVDETALFNILRNNIIKLWQMLCCAHNQGTSR